MWAIRDLSAGTYFWSVQAIDNAFNPSPWSEEGTFTVTEGGGVATSTDSDGLPSEFAVGRGYPNPFTDRMTVVLSVPESRHVSASVFSMLGEHVMTLKDALVPPGRQELRWNGRDAAGAEVSSGVYFLRIEAGDVSTTVQLTRVRP
jgi:flagellar hook assembly protein FlgD